jgi:hypothetical protein
MWSRSYWSMDVSGHDVALLTFRVEQGTGTAIFQVIDEVV